MATTEIVRLPREHLAAAIETLITLLDAIDGDPDIERNGDEEDDDGDTRDSSWTEWHSRGRHKHLIGHAGKDGMPIVEDDEADGDEQDGNGAEDEECAWHALCGNGPGCIIADPDRGAEDEGEREEGV